MEEYLLDCLDMLSRAGDDEVRRQNEIKKSPSWDLLDMEWKALAMVGAKKTAGEKVGSMANGGAVSRTKRRGRRGGRARRGIEDRVASPQSVIGGVLPVGYRLAVMIVQKHRMKGAWGDDLETEMNRVRQECAKGIHPVWGRLARESPLLAELGLFPIVQPEHAEVNSMAWIEGANFDYRDYPSLRVWLSSETPLKLSAAQMKVVKKIQSDLSGKARPSQWEEWMSPSLEGMSGEGSLLEGILLAAAESGRALEVLKGISGECSVVSSKHAELINARNGHFSNWSESSSCKADDGLSIALRIECWKGFKDNIGTPGLEDMIEGHELLEDSGEEAPSFLKWSISEDLIGSNRKEEALEYILGSDISSSENVSTCLELLDLDDSGSLEGSLEKHIDTSQEVEGILMILNHDCSTSSIRLHAASMLSSGDSIRHMDGILSAFTRTAEIGGLAECLVGDISLSRAYPFRAMVAWHLISANESVGKLQALEQARKTALISIELAKEDSVLSEVSIGLVSLLDGIPGDMSPVYDKLDSKGSRALNEVRVALSPKGNEVVRESSIEALEKSVNAAHLDAIERRLFEALVSALILNRAALDLQIGEVSREEYALASLESLISDEAVSMRTVKFASDLVFEHRVGIESLDSWYNENDRSGTAHQVVKAALLERKGEFVDAARAHRMAAMGTIEGDLERSATFLRRSLISFAHGGRWKDAVSLIDEYPTISASVTKRFKLYLRVCMDQAGGDSEKATWRLMEYVSSDLEEEEGGVSSELEGLESLWMYPDERNLPPEPFRGRVVVAKRKLRYSAESAMTQLDRDFEREMMRGEDTLKLVTLIEQIAGNSSIRGLRLFERAIGSGKFDAAGNKRLRDSQRILFTMKKDAVSIKERKNLKSLSLKPLVLIDTNILIDALKDDLLRDISGDSLGSLDWSINRAFHWMLRRRRDSGEILLCIPGAARSEFLHRVKTPDSVLRLFDNTYVDRKMWNEKVSDNLLDERVRGVLSEFENWSCDITNGELDGVELDDFLVNHGATFRIVDEHKRERQDKVAPRTVIGGEEIYPEKGDCDIMREASVIADSFHPGVGSIVVATRDSDFRLVSRALEESFGFGVVGDAQQLRLLS